MIEMNKILIVTVGLPRCGKSTWARKQNLPIVNLDSIRLSIHGFRYIEEAEPLIQCFAKYMVKSLFLAGHNKIILDATNLTKERREIWKNENWICEFKYFNTSKNLCIERAKMSGKSYLIPFIEIMDRTKEVEEFE